MRVTIELTYQSADVSEAMKQAVTAFSHVLATTAADVVAFQKFEQLKIGFAVDHPARPTDEAKRAHWHRASNTIFAGANLDYGAFVGHRWGARVDAVTEATRRAVSTVPKTRLGADERQRLDGMIERARAEVAASPPETLLDLKPILVHTDSDGRRVGIAFSVPDWVDANLRSVAGFVLHPDDVCAYFDQNPDPSEPLPFIRLYRRIDGKLHYREAWVNGDRVVEHVGMCGERGTVTGIVESQPRMQQKLLDRFSAAAQADGFRRIPENRLAGIVVSTAIEGFGGPEHLERRHALESFLDEVTGWRGLGHCDGGSIGSGSMEAFCLVVDAEVAVSVISRELATSPFADFSVRVMSR